MIARALRGQSPRTRAALGVFAAALLLAPLVVDEYLLSVILITLFVINRNEVRLVLDPFNPKHPAFALSMPFFWLMFALLLIGAIVGGMATWLTQGKWRRTARQRTQEAMRWKSEAERLAAEALNKKEEAVKRSATLQADYQQQQQMEGDRRQPSQGRCDRLAPG